MSSFILGFIAGVIVSGGTVAVIRMNAERLIAIAKRFTSK